MHRTLPLLKVLIILACLPPLVACGYITAPLRLGTAATASGGLKAADVTLEQSKGAAVYLAAQGKRGYSWTENTLRNTYQTVSSYLAEQQRKAITRQQLRRLGEKSSITSADKQSNTTQTEELGVAINP